MKPRSLAILAFLTICAAFFCLSLYILVVTSFKSMDEIRQGALFAPPQTWEARHFAWFSACSGMTCEGLQAGFWNSVEILVPSLVLSIALAMITG